MLIKNKETPIAISLFLLFTISIFLFVYLTYQSEKTIIYKHIDARLYSIAKAQVHLLSPDFHDRATGPSSISEAEDMQNIHRLSQLAKSAGLAYVYTMIEKNGKIYFTSSSASDEELQTGNNMTRYYDEYDDVDPLIHTAIHEKHILYDESADKWGSFRSVVIPMISPKGFPYSIGADMQITEVNTILHSQAVEHFTIAFGLFLISFFSLLWRLKYIKQLAFYDSLTGLPNRTEFAKRIAYTISSSERNNDTFAVLFLDLDHFKEINDTLGHDIGDQLLVQVSKRLMSILRKIDTASRMGGDEFVLLLPHTDADGARKVAQKILEIISIPYHIQEHELTITTSIGIALYPFDGVDLEFLSKNADSAMYLAKNEGRHGYQFFTAKLQESAQRRMDIQNALHHALEFNELELYYQPQISLDSGHVIGAEALLRWKHPKLGNVSPLEFIPVAEDSGLILPIGEWVLRTGIQEAKRWKEIGLPDMMIAINLSAVQFQRSNISELVSEILTDIKLDHQYLELELTESAAMHNPQEAIEVMKNLHKHGIKIAIDDFGTGYSSLAYLKKFNISKLKVDKSFIDEITTDADDKAIVGAIISMAHSLGLRVIAEGVETYDQILELHMQGCDEIQGYYYSKPLNAVDFEIFIKTHTKAIEFKSKARYKP